MNQILFTDNIIKKQSKQKNIKFIFLFVFSLISILLLLVYFIYNYNVSTTDESTSSSLLNRYNIQRLYSEENSSTIVQLNQNQNFFVIGSIEIPSLKINYPILSHTNDELLKIAPCRFYGPYPNEVGNLCIAAHNYDDNRFFGKLHELNIGDTIKIYDSSSSLINYYIYDKYEINKNNTSCTSQNTYGLKEITLVTCNNFNGNRLIIKAKE